MKIDATTLARVTFENQNYASQMARNTNQEQSSTQNMMNSSDQEMLFDNVLAQEIDKRQTVISAEQVLSQLDGTKPYEHKPFQHTNHQLLPVNSQAAVPSFILEKIEEASKRFGVDSDLVQEVVRAESSFNPNAVSAAGAKGLMQLMDATAQSLGVTNSFDPVQNINGGTKYLGQLLDRYDGNVKVALAAYNAGSGRVSRTGIQSDEDFERLSHLLPQETQRYVDKITDNLM